MGYFGSYCHAHDPVLVVVRSLPLPLMHADRLCRDDEYLLCFYKILSTLVVYSFERFRLPLLVNITRAWVCSTPQEMYQL